MKSRRLLSTSKVGLIFGGFLVYQAIQSLREESIQCVRVKVIDPAAFDSRIIKTPGGIESSSNNLKDIAINGNIVSADSRMAQVIGASAGNLSETQLRSVIRQFAKEIADYLTVKLPQNVNCSRYNVHWRHQNEPDIPIIYLVTPTYRRPEQIPDLTRMAQTLLNVPAVHWIVVEDSTTLSPTIAELLNRYGIPYTQLKAPMPEKYRKQRVKPRGVANRNAAIDWIRANVKSGIVYFADDDNTYDIRLFEEMRYTKKVSMWPVGLVTEVGLSSPVVNQHGRVVDFYDGWFGKRKFPVDMACFAVNVQLLLEKPDVRMPYVPGYEEDGLLKNLNITLADIEPKADGCTKILVWHTQTKSNTPANRTLAALPRFTGTNIDALLDWIV